MDDYISTLKSRLNLLNKAIPFLQERLSSPAPEGRIRIDNTRGTARFYLINDSTDKNGKYIKPEDHAIARRIIQRQYDEKALKATLKEKEYIEKIIAAQNMEEVFDSFSPERQKIITPVRMTDGQFIKWWYDLGTETKGVDPDAPQIFTNRGEHVRSKSEKIIADKLNELGIPYKYEHPLLLPGNIRIHPDFTALNVRLRKEFYIEHLGKMDSLSYVNDNIQRIEKYEKAGYYPGDTLILLHETSLRPLDTRVAEKILKRFLL